LAARGILIPEVQVRVLADLPKYISVCGAIWLACLFWKQKVVGSNPASPTKKVEA
tara:strand:+ start:81351 stop:81515 length:165 start_codon:yes stop_codon:yes gene_type:complete